MSLDDLFVSLIIVREPMDRLVSAWKDKINRRTGTDRQFYYRKYTMPILQRFLAKNFIEDPEFMDKNTCSNKQELAWDQGCRVPFKDFIKWIASGNQAADEHWTPAVQLCVACRAGYDFIGHAEHFNSQE